VRHPVRYDRDGRRGIELAQIRQEVDSEPVAELVVDEGICAGMVAPRSDEGPGLGERCGRDGREPTAREEALECARGIDLVFDQKDSGGLVSIHAHDLLNVAWAVEKRPPRQITLARHRRSDIGTPASSKTT
jgi:hypothetical protein